jgi:hypothetical protein
MYGKEGGSLCNPMKGTEERKKGIKLRKNRSNGTFVLG